MNDRRSLFVRLFCVCCAVAVLPLLPMAIATLTTVRRHPIELEGSRIIGGGAVAAANGTVIESIRFGDAAPVAAASAEARRRFRNLPPGTHVLYRLRDGRTVAGDVANVAADRATIVRRLVLAFLAAVSVIAGLAIGLAGRNRAALSAGGFLAGLGATLGFRLLEPNVVLIASPAWRDAVIALFVLLPAGLWCRFLLQLAAELPYASPVRRTERVIIEGVTVAAVARALLLASSQIANAGAAVLRLAESNLLQVVPYFATAVLTIVFIVRQRLAMQIRETGDLGERARLVAIGCAIGTGIPVAGAALQAAWLLIAGRLLLPREAMSLLLAPIALVPLSLSYALLARRVERPAVLAQRAIVFTVADGALTLVALLPLLLLGGFLYRHRAEPLAEDGAGVLALALLAIGGVAAISPARRALRRVFFRDSSGVFPLFAFDASDAAALAMRLEKNIDDALRVESAALFVIDAEHGMLIDPLHRLDPLGASSPLVSAREVVDLAEVRLSDAERLWAAQRAFRLLLPLRGRGAIAIGEKMSGLPFSVRDRALLEQMSAAAALALENFALRGVPLPARTNGGELARALICPACGVLADPLPDARCAFDATPLIPAAVPRVLHGKFRIDRRIGAGSMGVVYRARDLLLGRDVAIKTLPVLSPDAAERFNREARAAAALVHPSIAAIHAAEMWHGHPMLVFELLEGRTLADRIAGGPLDPYEVVRIGVAIAVGLEHAHAAGVVHRDVKPSNIGFTRDDLPRLLDFGLAAGYGDDGLAGTPAYLSPEAILGFPASPADDVWSTAVTLYEALTARHPFIASTATLTMNAILGNEVADPRSVRPDVPPELAELLMRALRRDPATRICTVRELRELLMVGSWM